MSWLSEEHTRSNPFAYANQEFNNVHKKKVIVSSSVYFDECGRMFPPYSIVHSKQSDTTRITLIGPEGKAKWHTTIDKYGHKCTSYFDANGTCIKATTGC